MNRDGSDADGSIQARVQTKATRGEWTDSRTLNVLIIQPATAANHTRRGAWWGDLPDGDGPHNRVMRRAAARVLLLSLLSCEREFPSLTTTPGAAAVVRFIDSCHYGLFSDFGSTIPEELPDRMFGKIVLMLCLCRDLESQNGGAQTNYITRSSGIS